MNYYSAKENAFYSQELKDIYIEAGTFPDDAIEISEKNYNKFAIESPPKGKQLRPNKGGKPSFIAISYSKDELIYAAEINKSTLLTMATDAIAPLQDAEDLCMATNEEQENLKAWKKFRVLVNRIDTSKAPDIDWPLIPIKS